VISLLLAMIRVLGLVATNNDVSIIFKQ
jgi:hypothetical protein